jgi:hypothetical protein
VLSGGVSWCLGFCDGGCVSVGGLRQTVQQRLVFGVYWRVDHYPYRSPRPSGSSGTFWTIWEKLAYQSDWFLALASRTRLFGSLNLFNRAAKESDW